MILEQIDPGAIERAQMHTIGAALVLLAVFLVAWWLDQKP